MSNDRKGKETEMKRNRKKTIIIGVFAGIVGTILLAYCVLMFLIPVCETIDQKAVEGFSDWMAAFQDDLPLGEVVLPGTHDSASYAPQLAVFSKCQNLTIKEQLDAGFRFLDIRLAVSGENIKLMHGFTACKTGMLPFAKNLYLDEVLNQCANFLDEHPTETILFAVKQEHGDESVDVFHRVLEGVFAKYASYLLKTDRMPTVGEARGKILLLLRYDAKTSEGVSWLPFMWNETDYKINFDGDPYPAENGNYTLWVQDRYKLDAEEKWETFANVQNKISAGPGDVYIDYLSTNGPPAFGHPYKYAKDLNSRLLTFDASLKGWVIVDFGTPSLAARIYRENFND